VIFFLSCSCVFQWWLLVARRWKGGKPSSPAHVFFNGGRSPLEGWQASAYSRDNNNCTLPYAFHVYCTSILLAMLLQCTGTE